MLKISGCRNQKLSSPAYTCRHSRCAGALWVLESEHFHAFRHCLSGLSPSRIHLPGVSGVPELSGCWNLSISTHLGTVPVAWHPPAY